MNREIKFRVWDTNNSVMFYPDEDNKTNFSRIVDGDRIGSDFNYNDLFDGLDRGLAPLQYVGLKDKNGKEIYEADVVNLEDYETSYVVRYAGSSFTIMTVKDAPIEYLLDKYLKFTTVVGNQFENPELLKP